MQTHHLAAVIDGLEHILNLCAKETLQLDYALLAHLVVQLTTAAPPASSEPLSEPLTPIDEAAFDVLASELQQIELTLEEESIEEPTEEPTEEPAIHTEAERQFLITQLSALFDRLQKMVSREAVDEYSFRVIRSCTKSCMRSMTHWATWSRRLRCC